LCRGCVEGVTCVEGCVEARALLSVIRADHACTSGEDVLRWAARRRDHCLWLAKGRVSAGAFGAVVMCRPPSAGAFGAVVVPGRV